ncbi:C1orf74 [Branchiostoma lanceolatum]|uniref:C1orf74 protein n=1 Tax=Branchiostoma lanceolatum TaxID=7740 RepID=A0A8J9ZY51_BRALA|nr:C1orf74 [Branchiostoma lanceolatum]
MAAASHLLTRWRQVVRNILGKKSAKHTADLMCDILAVDRDTSVAHLEAVQSDWHNFVVDVTFSLPEPRPATGFCTQTVRDCARDVVQYIAATMRDTSILQGNITPGESWNISTLFGLLVGYPVLYWYDPTQDSTCLSMVPLLVYNVYVCLDHDSATTAATALGEKSVCDCPDERNNHKHKLYSFSIPKNVKQDFSKQIDCWFKRVQEEFALQDAFCCLEMKCSEMTLPTVAL